jgi:hypothetical protein
LILLAAVLLAAPAAAQTNSAAPVEIPPAPAPRQDTVGPEQLREFSLPGTVTRRSDAPAEPRPSPAPTTAPPARAQATTGTPPPAQARPRPPAAAPAATAPTAAPEPELDRSAPPAPSLSLDLPPATPAPQQAPEPSAVPAPAPLPPVDDSPVRLWPWLLLALLAGGGALLWVFRRRARDQRGRYGELAFAGAAPAEAPEPVRPPAPRPTPAPPPLRPASETPPAPRPAADTPVSPPAPVGVVSSRLRPWIDLEFVPLRATLTDTEAVIDFELGILNSGSVPGRQVVVEAIILNAGEEQEASLATFYARANIDGEGIEAIPPLGRLPLRSQVRLPRAGIREYAADDRRLFVPIVAFNAIYRWSGGTGRTSASFLVGLDNGVSAKLGPLRLDQGPREWRTLAARLLPSHQRR